MHASTIVALALIAAAAPALSLPLEDLYARDTTDAPTSGAVKLDTGVIKDGVDIANGVIAGVDGIKNVFSSNKQQREFAELLNRALEEELISRDDSTDASGASILSTAKDIFEIGKGILGGPKSGQQQKREYEELFMRALEDELMARDESGASIFSTAKDIFTVGKNIYDGLQGNNLANGQQQQKREPMGILSGGSIGNIFAPPPPRPRAGTAVRDLVEREPISFTTGGIRLPPNFRPRIGSVVQEERDLVERSLVPGSVGSKLLPQGPPRMSTLTLSKRDEELIARLFNDFKPTYRLGPVRPVGTLPIQPDAGKREEEFLARALPVPSAGSFGPIGSVGPVHGGGAPTSFRQHNLPQGVQRPRHGQFSQGFGTQRGHGPAGQHGPVPHGSSTLHASAVQQGTVATHGPVKTTAQPAQGAQASAQAQEQHKRLLGLHFPHISAAMGRSLNELD